MDEADEAEGRERGSRDEVEDGEVQQRKVLVRSVVLWLFGHITLD